MNDLLSPYAPIRYRSVNWWDFARDAAKNGLVTASGQIARGLPDLIMNSLILPMTKAIAKQVDGTPDKEFLGSFMAKLMEFRHWIPLAAQYELCGRQIFDISDNLVEMLANTDIGDCTLENWHAPYDAFFVRFGQQESMSLEFNDPDSGYVGHEYLDGAFIGVTPWSDDIEDGVRIRFGFTTVRSDGSGMLSPGYFFDLMPEEQKMPISLAIDHAFARRLAAMQEGDDPNSDFDQALASHRRALLEDNTELVKKAVTLLVNTLFYIESAEEKERSSCVEPGRDTPSSFVVDWAQAKPEKKAKLRTKLNSNGYALVRFMGREFSGNNSQNQSGTNKTHWRRGHWRQQRWGEKFSLVKRIWLKPVMVNAERPHDDLAGHIYVVGSGDGKDSVH